MLGLTDFLLAGVLPGLAALAVRAIVLRATSRESVAWPLAVAVGYLVGHVGLATQNSAAIDGWPAAFRSAVASLAGPTEASQWLPLAALSAAAVAMLLSTGGVPRIAGIFAGLALAIALPTRLLWGSVYLLSEWSQREAVLRIGGLAALAFAVGWLLTKSAAREPKEEEPRPATFSDSLIAPLLVFVALGVSTVLATSGSLSYARLAGVVVASITGAMFGGLGQTKFSEVGVAAPAAGPVVTTLAGGLILLGLLYAEVTTANAALLTLALAAAGAKHGWAPKCQWRAATLRVLCCLVPLSIATATAATEFAAATSQAEKENPYLNWSPPE